jgi:hypothetical protein
MCAMFSRLFQRTKAGAPLSPVRRTAAGLAFLLVIVAASAFFLWLAQANVFETGGAGRGPGRGWGRGHAATEAPFTRTVAGESPGNKGIVHAKNQPANDKRLE